MYPWKRLQRGSLLEVFRKSANSCSCRYVDTWLRISITSYNSFLFVTVQNKLHQQRQWQRPHNQCYCFVTELVNNWLLVLNPYRKLYDKWLWLCFQIILFFVVPLRITDVNITPTFPVSKYPILFFSINRICPKSFPLCENWFPFQSSVFKAAVSFSHKRDDAWFITSWDNQFLCLSDLRWNRQILFQ